MKNEPAQNLEIEDSNPAVGTRPLTLRRAFGTARWRPVFRLHQLRTMRKKPCLSGEALRYQQASPRQAPMTLKSLGRCEAQRDNEDASLRSVTDQASSSAKADEPVHRAVSANSPSPIADAAFAAHDGSCCFGSLRRRVALTSRLRSGCRTNSSTRSARSRRRDCPWRGPRCPPTASAAVGRRPHAWCQQASAPWPSASVPPRSSMRCAPRP